MPLGGVITAVLLVQVSAMADITWFPCPIHTVPPPGFDDGQAASCAIYKAPLCHPGICKTPDTANSTVGVFVKRFIANNSATAPNVWLVQGGPGYSASAVDTSMVQLYLQLQGEVNLYMMDHHGTGQSTKLTCEAVEAASALSNTSDIEPSTVPACAQELQEKYGDLAAFSTTSAATDLANSISEYGNDYSTTVYGVGYGSMWVERLMHLGPPEAVGYVLDGVSTSSVSSPDKIMNVSSLDVAAGEVGDAFLALCAEDKVCSSRFKKKGLKAALKHAMAKLDKNPSSSCSKVLKAAKNGQDNDPPSFVLRYLLGVLLSISDSRTLIPPIVYRLLRCAKKDVDVLSHSNGTINKGMTSKDTVDDLSSWVLDNLVTYSKLWEIPTPSVSEMKALPGVVSKEESLLMMKSKPNKVDDLD